MRLVRFHLEPWQKGGSDFTVTPCASPLPLNARAHRRQRSADLDLLAADDVDGDAALSPELIELRAMRKRAKQWRWRYPQVVKRLAIMCSDVIARNVIITSIEMGIDC